MKEKNTRIGIVGGGVAGSSIALYLSSLGLEVSLFEKGESLVNGPPICHLHAGGNLYREISDKQCITLLKQSIDLVRFLPLAVDYRPTVIAIPIDDEGKPDDLCHRLHLLEQEYHKLIDRDKENKVLGDVEDYFKTYSREDVEKLKNFKALKYPKSLDEWMIPASQGIDLDKIKYPLVIVQEYGLNIFRIAASLSLALDELKNAHIYTNTLVTNISQKLNSWDVEYKHDNQFKKENFDFLINAAGFKSGEIDDMLGYKRERLVEFKAAYVTKWEGCDTIWPEVIFHGKRGTPQGMAQFTPYPDGYFQLHGMTKAITLFDDGLVKNSLKSSQPKLDKRFIEKIDRSWKFSDVKKRTKLAIEHVSQFIPEFQKSEITDKPFYGAQQIPGDDASLRASDISIVDETYARCEIVKASSVLSMADNIYKQLIGLNLTISDSKPPRDFENLVKRTELEVDEYAKELCKQRGYPLALARRNVAKWGVD